MDVSVVVPTRDRPGSLRDCLAALAAQTLPSLEVIVVDDGSRDRRGVAEAVAALSGVRLIRTPGVGPAGARNLGARAAGGEIVAFTDDDCEPRPDWARTIAAVAAKAGAAGGATVAPSRASASVRASQTITNHLQLGGLRAGRLTFVPTCNLAAQAQVLRRIPFDETFPLAAGEDRDWSARALAAGFELGYAPGAVVVHRQRLGPRGFWRQQFRYGRGAARFRGSDTGRRMARPGFYGGLVRRGFAEGAAAGMLVLAAQLATTGGVAFERATASAGARPPAPHDRRP